MKRVHRPRSRSRRGVILAAFVLVCSSLFTLSLGASPAGAAGCYTFSRSLASGATGSDVLQLQTRVAGWAGYGVNMSMDGSYGPQTVTAVRNFQAAYGLTVDGKAGPQTFAKLGELEDADCSTKHFAWSEVDGGCGAGGFSGGTVSATQVKENLRRAMWRAEAVRQRLGNAPMNVSSGFRSRACDRSVGGSGTGYHTYGMALDITTPSFCSVAKAARYSSFGTILGPGYPDHNDHAHIDTAARQFWRAPNCGI